MDYEKMYKDALERAIYVKENTDSVGAKDVSDVIEYIFHGLKESEDEKIRKELLEHCKNQAKSYIKTGNECPQIQSWIAWLKKQSVERKQLYVRFGDIPLNEKSKIYRGEEEIGDENGVSVYPAFELNGNVVLGLTLPITRTTLYTQQHLLEYDNRPCYLVTGDYVGRGTDGEPLIRNISIIKRLDNYRIKELEKQGESDETKAKTFLINKGYPIDANGKFPTYEEMYDIIKDGLEKQGEQKQDPCEHCNDMYLNCHNFPCIKKRAFEQGKSVWEIINEEKVDNANKVVVEPKFKVGDWIFINGLVLKIQEVRNDLYETTLQNGELRIYDTYILDNDAHLWTIQDAKDGDVLAFYSEYKGNKMVQVGIIEKYIGRHGGCSNSFKTYVGVNWENNLQLGKYMGCSDIHPATKEQRDLLFQKMKEAGYEWDAVKKELKKIKPLFNVGDTIIKKHNSDINDFGQFTITDITGGKYWYNDRIICDITEQDKWEIYEPVRQEPAWSEEDEEMCIDAIKYLELFDAQGIHGDVVIPCIDWLKSIKDRVKPQWKPSDEQMKQLKNAANIYPNSRLCYGLKTLYEDLKKL